MKIKCRFIQRTISCNHSHRDRSLRLFEIILFMYSYFAVLFTICSQLCLSEHDQLVIKRHQIFIVSIFRIKNSLNDILVALGAEDKNFISDEATDEEKKDKEKPDRKCEALIIISSLISSSLR